MDVLPYDVLELVINFLNIKEFISYKNISHMFYHIISNIKNNKLTRHINVNNIFFNNSDILAKHVIEWSKRIIMCCCYNTMYFPFLNLIDVSTYNDIKKILSLYKVTGCMLICCNKRVYYESDCDYEEVENYHVLYENITNMLHIVISYKTISNFHSENIIKYKYYCTNNLLILQNLIMYPDKVIKYIDINSIDIKIENKYIYIYVYIFASMISDSYLNKCFFVRDEYDDNYNLQPLGLADENCDIDDDLEKHDHDINYLRTNYENIYNKYYVNKLSAKRLIIEYSYPLINKIRKLYVNDNGFSINDIANIINNKYKKMYDNYYDAMSENRSPKYFLHCDNIYSRPDISILFTLSMTNTDKFKHKVIENGESISKNNILLVKIMCDT